MDKKSDFNLRFFKTDSDNPDIYYMSKYGEIQKDESIPSIMNCKHDNRMCLFVVEWKDIISKSDLIQSKRLATIEKAAKENDLDTLKIIRLAKENIDVLRSIVENYKEWCDGRR